MRALIATCVLVCCGVLPGAAAPALARADSGQTQIRLVSARDHIDGGMTTPQSVYADATRIYLATFTGKLFVLARDRAAGFPVVQVIQDTTVPLTAVRGDKHRLYVTAWDGLRVYEKGDTLVPVASKLGSVLSSLAVVGDRLYVSRYQGKLAVDRDHVYLSQLNPGDVAAELSSTTLATLRTYGEAFEPHDVTVVFDRRTGERLAAVPNPLDFRGQPGLTSIYADGQLLALNAGSCCGLSIFLHDARTLTSLSSISTNANATVRRRDLLVVGGEEGFVKVFDFTQQSPPQVAVADLRTLTGHTGSEDIEIRALWMDRRDNLIFAGSSWGNDLTRGPDLPSFFVLDLQPG